MARKQPRPRPHGDVRHRSHVPMPAVEDVAPHLMALLRPSRRAPRPLARHDPRQPPRLIRLRQRLLTLPVMVASMVGVVWRRIPAVAEGPKIVARAGVVWVAPVRVRPQALTTRLDVWPAAVLGPLCTAGCARVPAQAPPPVPPPRWAPVREHVPLLAMVAGSTRAALRHKTAVWRQREGLVWAGKTRVRVEACSHRRRWQR